jgi:hypothetical protein
MATFSEVKAVRLTINDPAEFIDIIQVANLAALPVSPAPQVAYNLLDTGAYMMHNGSAYVPITDLQVADSRIGEWVDGFQQQGAVIRSFAAIITKLGARLQMVKNSDGAESTEYTSIDKMLAFYRQISADYSAIASGEEKRSTGRWGKGQAIEIAGGMV